METKYRAYNEDYSKVATVCESEGIYILYVNGSESERFEEYNKAKRRANKEVK